MKAILAIISGLIITAALVACALPPAVDSPSPSAAKSPSPAPSLTEKDTTTTPTSISTPEPVPTPTLTLEPEPDEVPPFDSFRKPNSGTVVIADHDGMVYFGFSDGQWLTHSQAASYCGQKMKFYKLSLSGAKGYVTSASAVEDTDSNWDESSLARNGSDEVYDSNSSYLLKLNGKSNSLLCHIDAENIPKTVPLKNKSKVLSSLQALADKQFGAGKVKVRITSAISVDIDGDGKKEIVVNASNNENRRDEDDRTGYWYSIACAIEDDGSYAFLEECYVHGFIAEESQFIAVRSVLDIDGDGACEFIVYSEAWEYWGIYICRLENGNLIVLAGYDWCV